MRGPQLFTLLSTLFLCLASNPVEAQWKRLWEYTPNGQNPERRAAHGMVLVKDKLVVFGGIGDNDERDDIEYDDSWMFDLTKNSWKKLIHDTHVKPTKRFHHTAVGWSNSTIDQMLIFGGLSISQSSTGSTNKGTVGTDLEITQNNDIWRLSFDDSSNTSFVPFWEKDQLAKNDSVPSPRSEPSSVVYKDQMIIFGGISYDTEGVRNPQDYNDLWSYDLHKRVWRKIEPTTNRAPPARFSHSSSLVYDGNQTYMVVFSGRHLEHSTWSLLDDIWLFSFDDEHWIEVKAGLPIERAYTSVISIGTDLWFFGGYYKPNTGTAGYVYDDVVNGKLTMIDKDTSVRYYHGVPTTDEQTPPLRYNHRAASYKDCMLIFGGSYEIQRGDLWIYNTTQAVTRELATNGMPIDIETMVYVLGAFIVTIILILTFLLIRWRRMDQRAIQLARMRAGLPPIPRGVSKERLDQMVITKYEKPKSPTNQGDTNVQENSESDDICPICLIEFEEDEEVRNLPCKHIFHVACVDEWLKRNTLCPMCKSNLDQHTPNNGTTGTRRSEPPSSGNGVQSGSIQEDDIEDPRSSPPGTRFTLSINDYETDPTPPPSSRTGSSSRSGSATRSGGALVVPEP